MRDRQTCIKPHDVREETRHEEREILTHLESDTHTHEFIKCNCLEEETENQGRDKQVKTSK